MRFWKCFWYLIQISIASFFVGRLLPKKWFCYNRFPFRTYGFENEGRIYEKLKIRKWQNKVPDMSKLFPFMMPQKRMTAESMEKLPEMIRETCVAEWIHGVNAFLGTYCMKLYPGIAGAMIALLYAVVFNVPFIWIQRYNRPRLLRLEKRLKKRREAEAKVLLQRRNTDI